MVFVMKLSPGHEAIVSRFRRSHTRFFHKVMTKTTVTETVKGPFALQMEFPLQFLDDYANLFEENATLVKPDCRTQWPLAVTVREFRSDDKKRVFAYGDGGWRRFVEENEVNIGDLLIFHLISYSRFMVHIFPKVNRVKDIEPQEAAPEEEATDETPNEIKCAECRQSPPARPSRFMCTVRNVCGKTRLEVPINFWRRHRRSLRDELIQLKGPNNVSMEVKYEAYARAASRKVRARLVSGWNSFFKANNLVIGDKLLFTLTGQSRFDVEVLNRDL